MILEQPEETERSNRYQEESRQREIDDLIAQKDMADGTNKIVLISLLQTILAAVGTAALIYTILLNRSATEAAHKAVAVARDTLKSQNALERGRMKIARFKVGLSNEPKKTASIEIDVMNVGKATVWIPEWSLQFLVLSSLPDIPSYATVSRFFDSVAFSGDRIKIGQFDLKRPNGKSAFPIASGEDSYVIARFTCEDLLGNRWHWGFCYRVGITSGLPWVKAGGSAYNYEREIPNETLHG